MRTLTLAILTTTLVLAQAPQTQTSLLPSIPSQTNGPTAALVMNATVTAPGEAPSPLLAPLTATSPSTTLAYVSFGSTTFPAPGAISLSGALQGQAGAPFLLALSVMNTSQFCGGFAGWPCMTGPTLFSSVATSFGTYHLDASPIIVLDGLSNPAFQLDPSGNFGLSGVIPVDTVTNGGIEQSFALQAAINDATSPSGFRLTACLNVDQWVFYL